jgi:alpha-tubulin suppressor-like RCC1 family protein
MKRLLTNKTLLVILAFVLTLSLGAFAVPVAPAAAAPPAGTVWAWGVNNINSTTTKAVPVTMPGGITATAIAGGWEQSVALTSAGTVYAWGDDSIGELGNGLTGAGDSSSSPVQVVGGAQGGEYLTGITAIASGYYFSLALTATGVVYAWGGGAFGALGNGSANNSDAPVQVSLPSGVKVTAIAAGGFFGLALTSTGAVYGWGENNLGQLGDNNISDTDSSPVQVLAGAEGGGTYLSGVTAIAAGMWHALAVTSAGGGTAYAWGNGANGQLGNGDNGTLYYSNVPVQVENLTDITAIAGSNGDSLALKSDGTVWAWGDDYYGELGNGSPGTAYSDVPVQVSDLTDITAIGGGSIGSSFMALKSDGTVWDWGDDYYGELGIGLSGDIPSTTTHYTSDVPVQVLVQSSGDDLTEITAIGAGDDGNYALTVPPTITTSSLPTGQVGVAYPSTNLAATGGFGSYSWSISGEPGLPTGLSLNPSTGAISGTPTETFGPIDITFMLTDGAGDTATVALSLTVNPATPTPPPLGPPPNSVGNKVSGTMGMPSVTVTVPGDLNLGTLNTLGTNGPIGSTGSVATVLATDWNVTATAAVPGTPPVGYVAGAMSDGSKYLTEPLSISTNGTTFVPATATIEWTPNPSSLPFYAEQTISQADVALGQAGQSFSIEIVFTGNFVD